MRKLRIMSLAVALTVAAGLTIYWRGTPELATAIQPDSTALHVSAGRQAPVADRDVARERIEVSFESDPDSVKGSPEEEPNDPIRNLKRSLARGELTRASHGSEYDEAISRVALDTIRKTLESQASSRAAEFSGFPSWESLESTLTQLKQDDPFLAAQLGVLIDASVGASGYVEQCSIQAWDDPLHLEVWDPDSDHDGAVWAEPRAHPDAGLLKYQAATRVGDRAFRLHFDSYFFPSLEAELDSLKLRKADFWERMRAR